MKVYKYVQTLEPDSYYGGPDEEILFYCTDLNKKNKIKEYLISVIDENRLQKSKEFFKNKKYYNARVFYDFNKNILGLISDINEYFIFEDALRLNSKNNDFEYYFSGCVKGHHQFVVGCKNVKTSDRKIIDLKVSKEKFESYNLSECEYYQGERYICAKTPINSEIHYGNYDLFEKKYTNILTKKDYDVEIKKIKNNYKLIEININ